MLCCLQTRQRGSNTIVRNLAPLVRWKVTHGLLMQWQTKFSLPVCNTSKERCRLVQSETQEKNREIMVRSRAGGMQFSSQN